MKTKLIIIALITPLFFYGQEVNKDVKNIDAIVELINSSEEKYSEKTNNGTIEKKGDPKKTGKWEANYLYNKKILLRTLYNRVDKERSENFEFYYENEKLIFVTSYTNFFHRKTNKIVSQKCYLKNLEKIKCENTTSKEYTIDFLKTEENKIFSWK